MVHGPAVVVGGDLPGQLGDALLDALGGKQDFHDDSSSARRPPEGPAAEQVQVQVRHRLAGPLLAVEDQPIAVRQAQLLRQLRRDQVQMAEQLAVLRLDVRVGRDDLARDDEDVDRRLRVDVVEGDAVVVLVDDAGPGSSSR